MPDLTFPELHIVKIYARAGFVVLPGRDPGWGAQRDEVVSPSAVVARG